MGEIMVRNNGIGFFADEIPEKLIFAGKEIHFDEVMYRYAAAKAEFTPQALKSIQQMEANFSDEIGSLDKFLNQGSAWIYHSLSDLLDFTIEQLSLNGCYAAEKKAFFEQYVADKIIVMPQIYEQMEKIHDEIDRRQAEKNAERVAERKLHVATGSNEIGEMLWNGMKRGGDELKNRLEKAGYYNDDVKQQIKLEYKSICLTMVDSFAEALWDIEHVDLRNPIASDDSKRTQAMFDNLRANKIPEARVNTVAFEIFEKNPIIPNFLNWAVARYGNADGEMQKIADAFHVSIKEAQKILLKKVFDALDFSSEEKTLASKETLEKEEARLQYSNDEFTAIIEKHLADFDREARTVDGIEYETRDLANKAATLRKFFDSLDFSSEEAILKSQQLLTEKEKEIGFSNTVLEQKITDLLKTQDQNARTFNGFEYKTREEAAEAKRQYGELIETINSSRMDTADDIQLLIDKIQKTEYSIPQAKAVMEKLQIRQEMLKVSLGETELKIFRLAMSMQGKIVISVILTVICNWMGDTFVFIFLVWLISLFFTTRKKFAKYMETFIKKKNFKLAAICFELSYQRIMDFLGISTKNTTKN